MNIILQPALVTRGGGKYKYGSYINTNGKKKLMVENINNEKYSVKFFSFAF